MKQNGQNNSDNNDNVQGCLKLFHTRTRFLLMVLVLLCLASVWSNILCFNFAIICINADAEEAAGITVGVTDDIGSATNPPIPSDEFADQPTTGQLKFFKCFYLWEQFVYMEKFFQCRHLDSNINSNFKHKMRNRKNKSAIIIDAAKSFSLIVSDSLNGSAHNTTSSTQIFTPRQRLYLTSAVAAAALIANFVVVSMVGLIN